MSPQLARTFPGRPDRAGADRRRSLGAVRASPHRRHGDGDRMRGGAGRAGRERRPPRRARHQPDPGAAVHRPGCSARPSSGNGRGRTRRRGAVCRPVRVRAGRRGAPARAGQFGQRPQRPAAGARAAACDPQVRVWLVDPRRTSRAPPVRSSAAAQHGHATPRAASRLPTSSGSIDGNPRRRDVLIIDDQELVGGRGGSVGPGSAGRPPAIRRGRRPVRRLSPAGSAATRAARSIRSSPAARALRHRRRPVRRSGRGPGHRRRATPPPATGSRTSSCARGEPTGEVHVAWLSCRRGRRPPTRRPLRSDRQRLEPPRNVISHGRKDSHIRTRFPVTTRGTSVRADDPARKEA